MQENYLQMVLPPIYLKPGINGSYAVAAGILYPALPRGKAPLEEVPLS